MKINGIGASSGVALAEVFILKYPEFIIDDSKIENNEEEIVKFELAITKSLEDINRIRNLTLEKLGAEKAMVFEAHLLVLQDPEFIAPIKQKINENFNSAYALNETAKFFISIFENMDNEYMKERAADIKDVSNRVLSYLLNLKLPDLALINKEVIIVAEDLTPSETSQLNKDFVKGFVTNIGGRTSHSAIMARSLEIPAVLGTNNILDSVKDGDVLFLDGDLGNVILNPNEEEKKHFLKTFQEQEESKQLLLRLKDAKSITSDNHHVELVSNIGSPNDLTGVLANGAEGIGLYRTEFLYMDSTNFPTEEDQFNAYKVVLEKMENKAVVIRTLDIGGDKELPYLKLPHEMNPFLGYRAIRICLDQKDLFKTQIRALLRASVYGNLKIMFPMIATVSEFLEAKEFTLATKEELLKEGIAVNENIEIGMMVEIPAAAVMADQFAKHVDFFSIGTNDLIQYTFAADRMNEKVSYLYQPYNPAILRLVKNVIDASHKENKWTGMCGEMAGDLKAIPLLVGLGLDEFSMSASSVLKARELIGNLNYQNMQKLALEAISKSTTEEVLDLINNI